MKAVEGLAIFGLFCGAISLTTHAQTVIATIKIGTSPKAVTVNPNTNKIYVASPPGYVYVIDGKRLTNTPVGQAGFVLKCPDDRKNRVVSAQATYPCGGSAVGGRVCEQRYAAE